jgi:hypothetical protein
MLLIVNKGDGVIEVVPIFQLGKLASTLQWTLSWGPDSANLAYLNATDALESRKKQEDPPVSETTASLGSASHKPLVNVPGAPAKALRSPSLGRVIAPLTC